MKADFDRFITRFRQFGGWRLVWRYMRMGVLWTGIKALAVCALRGRSFKDAYPVITKRVDKILLKQYNKYFDFIDEEQIECFISTFCEKDNQKQVDGNVIKENVIIENPAKGENEPLGKPKIAWVIWLQGFEYAPEIVRACVAFQQRNLTDYEFRFVTETNYREWITLPYYIEEKRQKGQIPDALFSDLLRLELLVRYGGLYMDATVLCTGFRNERLRAHWTEIEQSEFFIFRYFKHGQSNASGLSNWFFSVLPCHIVLTAVRNALFAYWCDYDCLVDYYIMHLFLDEALRHFPKLLDAMPRGNSYHCIILGDLLAKDFDASAWKDLTEHVCFHKLNFRKANNAARNPNSFYKKIFNAVV